MNNGCRLIAGHARYVAKRRRFPLIESIYLLHKLYIALLLYFADYLPNLQFYNTRANTDKATKAPAPHGTRIPGLAPDSFSDNVCVGNEFVDFVPIEPVVLTLVEPDAFDDTLAEVVVMAVKGVPQ